jgi:hypothetical protein
MVSSEFKSEDKKGTDYSKPLFELLHVSNSENSEQFKYGITSTSAMTILAKLGQMLGIGDSPHNFSS